MVWTRRPVCGGLGNDPVELPDRPAARRRRSITVAVALVMLMLSGTHHAWAQG
jgi:hypothetical protein